MSTLRILVILVLSLVSLPAYGQVPATLEGNRLYEHIKYLADDSCGGRAPGTRGIDNAAAYLVDNFKMVPLKVGGTDGYLHPFTMTTGVKLGEKNSASFNVVIERPGIPLEQTKPTKLGWKLGVDYQPWGFSESGTVSAPLVFAGYGIAATAYNDYEGVDVKGKVVIILRGLPKWAEKDEAMKAQASLRTKATVARDKGATAVIFVNERGDSSDVLARFGMDKLGKNSGIIAIQARRTPCSKVFPPKGTSLFVAETNIEKTKKPQSFELANTTIDLTTSLAFEESVTRNVIGILRGTDGMLSNEYVVVGAHYDHLGMGDENSLASSPAPSIHYGADDNASGTAGVLELAYSMAKAPPLRSVIFMCFSGEEKGLLGSKHWVSNPTVPLENVVAMINLDMIGRLKDKKLNIQGTGTSDQWPTIIDSAKAGLDFVISTTADGFGPSDHSSFTAKSIPVLFFFTGLHSDYHRPSDTYDKINGDGESQILKMVERVVRNVANTRQRIEFTPGAEKPSTQQSSSIALKVTFGVVPDYSDDPQGLRISGVKPGSPAEKAGLASDDVITALGSTQVKNIYDLMAALGSFKPGDVADVKFIRNGKATSKKVTFVGK